MFLVCWLMNDNELDVVFYIHWKDIFWPFFTIWLSLHVAMIEAEGEVGRP